VVAIPTLKDEDAKRPSRERESLVGEQSRIVNTTSCDMRAPAFAFGKRVRGKNMDAAGAPAFLRGMPLFIAAATRSSTDSTSLSFSSSRLKCSRCFAVGLSRAADIPDRQLLHEALSSPPLGSRRPPAVQLSTLVAAMAAGTIHQALWVSEAANVPGRAEG
jgi:hypothetical protein